MLQNVIYDVASIGWGVQSTGIAILCGMGKLPMPNKFYYSDLRRESSEVYEYMEYAKPILANMGVTVETITAKDIYSDLMNWQTADRISTIPVWFSGEGGRAQPLQRQCTQDYKIVPIAKKIREDLGVTRLKRHSVRIWQGISLDEVKRAKSLFPSENEYGKYRVNHFPFIGQYANLTYPGHNWESFSREKIKTEVFKKNGIKIPPKSSCFFCPYHGIEYWYHIYTKFPDEWALAVALDECLRNYNSQKATLVSGPFYLHQGLIPLKDIDFDYEFKKKASNQLIMSGCDSGFCFM
jgi:hypothetical protein